MLDLAIHLRERFFAAHSQHGVPKTDQQQYPGQTRRPTVIQPSEGLMVHRDGGATREGRQMRWVNDQGNYAPEDEYDDHYGRDLHDAEGLFAGFVDALRV